MLPGLCHSFRRLLNPLPTSPVLRILSVAFSKSHFARLDDPHTPPLKTRQDQQRAEKNRHYQREWRKARYATDAEFRRKVRQQNASWYRRNPDKARQKRLRRDQRRREDTERRRRSYEMAKKTQKPKDDATLELIRAKSRAQKKRRRKSDPHVRRRAALYTWFWSNTNILDRFVWPSHVPVYCQDKIERRCATCAFTRISGMRLWFRRKSDPDLYDCFPCFYSNWNNVVPIDGPKSFYRPRQTLMDECAAFDKAQNKKKQ